MKRLVKVVLATALTVSALQTTVFADELPIDKVIDTEVVDSYTFYIKEDNSLWVNSEGEFKKICDDVKKVETGAGYGFAFVILNDNSLYVYDCENGTLTFMADNINDVSGFASYIVTGDNKLYQVVLSYYGDDIKIESTKLVDTNVVDVEAFDSYYDNGFCLYIKADGTLWAYGYDALNLLQEDYVDYTTPVQIMSNVAQVAMEPMGGFNVLTNDGKLYFVGTYYDYEKVYTIDEPLFISDDVKRVECDDFLGLFYIKNDNSLWVNNAGYGAVNSDSSIGSTEGTPTSGSSIIVDETNGISFDKIAEDVTDVASTYTHTTYVTEDGELYGYGENYNNQLGDQEAEYLNNFDENGFREIATDVKSADVSDNISTIIKNDDTLYGLGDSISGEEVIETTADGDSTMVKIAEDVSYAEADYYLNYVQGENNELYSIGNTELLTEEQQDLLEENYYRTFFDYFGIKFISIEDVEKNYEKYGEIIDEKASKMTEEEFDELFDLVYDSQIELFNSFETVPIAENVLKGNSGGYLTEDNKLYEIRYNYGYDNVSAEKKLVAGNVKDYDFDYDMIYIVGTDDKLYTANTVEEIVYVFDYYSEDYDFPEKHLEDGPIAYSWWYMYDDEGNFEKAELTFYNELDNYTFKYSGLDDIKAVETELDSSYVLKNDNTLWDLEPLYTDYVYVDKDGQYNGKVYIDGYDYELSDLDLDRSVLTNTDVYVGNDMSEDYRLSYYNDEFVQFNYYENGKVVNMLLPIYSKNELYSIGGGHYTMSKVADDVKDFDYSGYTVFYVTEDGELFGKGTNSVNQLGYQDELYVEEFVKIMDDVESVSSNYEKTLIVKTDGTLLGAGLNREGELGFEGVGYTDPFRIQEPVKIDVK